VFDAFTAKTSFGTSLAPPKLWLPSEAVILVLSLATALADER
jgi:hypothetical protein